LDWFVVLVITLNYRQRCKRRGIAIDGTVWAPTQE